MNIPPAPDSPPRKLGGMTYIESLFYRGMEKRPYSDIGLPSPAERYKKGKAVGRWSSEHPRDAAFRQYRVYCRVIARIAPGCKPTSIHFYAPIGWTPEPRLKALKP